MRWVEMHDWPAWLNPATGSSWPRSPGRVGLDDHRRVVAELEPDLLAGRPARMPQPTSGEPVNVIMRDVGVVDERVADGAPPPVTTLSQPGGQAALVEQELGERERGQRRLPTRASARPGIRRRSPARPCGRRG